MACASSRTTTSHASCASSSRVEAEDGVGRERDVGLGVELALRPVVDAPCEGPGGSARSRRPSCRRRSSGTRRARARGGRRGSAASCRGPCRRPGRRRAPASRRNDEPVDALLLVGAQRRRAGPPGSGARGMPSNRLEQRREARELRRARRVERVAQRAERRAAPAGASFLSAPRAASRSATRWPCCASQSAGSGAQPPPSSGTRSRPSRQARRTAAASARFGGGARLVAVVASARRRRRSVAVDDEARAQRALRRTRRRRRVVAGALLPVAELRGEADGLGPVEVDAAAGDEVQLVAQAPERARAPRRGAARAPRRRAATSASPSTRATGGSP